MLLLGGLISLGQSGAGAATWVGNTSADFSNGLNWTAGVVPTLAGDTLVFGTAGSSGLTLNNDISGQAISSGGITFNAGASAFTLNGNAVTVGSGSVVTFTNNSSNLQTINLPLNLTQSLAVAGGASLTLGGAIAHSGSGARAVTNNMTSGNLTISGNISMSSSATARTWTFDGNTAGSTIITGNLVNGGAGVGSLTVNMTNPSGNLTLSGASTYTGATTVSLGTLRLDFSPASAPLTNIINQATNSSALTLNSGATLNVIGQAAASNSQQFNGTTFGTQRLSSIRITQNGATSIDLSLGSLTRSAASTVDFTLPTSGFITTTSTSANIGTNNILANGAGNAYATVDGATWATNTAGTLGALAAGSYVTSFAASADNDVTSSLSPAVFTTNTVRFNTAGQALTLDSAGVSTLTSGGILVTAAGGGSSIASGGGSAALQAGSGRELIIINNSTGMTGFTIAARILDNGSSGLTVTGPGLTKLTGMNNTYAGATTVIGNVLDVGTLSNGSLGPGGLNLITGAILQGNGSFSRALAGSLNAGVGQVGGSNAGFAAKGGSLTVNFGGASALVTLSTGSARFGENFIFGSPTADSPVIIQNPLATGGQARTFTVNSGVGGDYAELQGVLSGDGVITKNGTGRLVLSASNNTYTGTTTVTAGVLDVGTISNGSLGTGGLLLTGNAVLQGNGSFTRPLSSNGSPGVGQVASASGGFAAKGGVLTVNFGGNAVPSEVALSASGFRFGTNFVFGSSTSDSPVIVLNPLSTVGAARTITVNSGVGGDSAELQGVISNNGSIIKNGTGILTLSAENTYSGGTALNAGTLNLNNSGSGGTSSSLGTGLLTITAGTLNNTSAGAVTLSTNNPVALNGDFAFGGTQDLNLGTGIVTVLSANRVVTLNNNKTLTMGQLQLSSNSERTLTATQGTGSGGKLSLGGFQLNISGTAAAPINRVINGTGNVDITGPVVNGTAFANNLTYSGTAVLSLSGANTYTGMTTVSSGLVKLDHATALPGGIATTGGTSGLLFNGTGPTAGVIGLTAASGDFTRSIQGLTPGADRVGWTNGGWGGFAAFGGDRSVNFGGANAPVTWSTSGGVFGNGLILSHALSDSTVTVTNPIVLTSTRTIQVNDGSAAVDGVMSGVLSGTAMRLNKIGAGTLVLTGTNTYSQGAAAGTIGTGISEGTLQIGNGGITGSIAASGDIENNAALAFNRSDNLLVGNTIVGTGMVHQIGAGTTTLTAANTYSGATNVTLGTLLINNTTGSGTGAGAVITLAGTVLGGTGTLSPASSNSINIGGSLAPGTPATNSGVGTLLLSPVSGDAVFTNTSTLDLQLLTGGLHGYTPIYNLDGTLSSLTGSYVGGGNDRLVFNGGSGANRLDFSNLGTANLNLTFGSGYVPAVNDLFDLLDWTNLSGTGGLNNAPSAITGLSLAQLDLPALSGGLAWDTSLWISHGVVGVMVIPEPSRGLLFILGLSVLMMRRRSLV
jgi:fibronectin-binding autotransporter adhesin